MKKTLRSSVLFVACLIVVSLVGAQATAEVVLSNRPSWTDRGGPCMGVNGTWMVAVRFTVPASPDYVLNSVTAKVHSTTDTAPSLQMTLHDDASGSSQPGNLISTLGAQPLGALNTYLEYTFSGGGAVLAGGSTYWIGLTVLSSNQCDGGWSWVDTSPTGTFSYQGTALTQGGWIPTSPADIEIDASVQADLSITKTVDFEAAEQGNQVTYTIVVANAGPSNAPAVAVNDTFPAEVSGVSWTCVGSGGATCTAGPVSGDISDTANLPAGGTVTYTAIGVVSVQSSTTVTNQASISLLGGEADPTPGDHTATASFYGFHRIPTLDGVGLTVLMVLLALVGLWVVRRTT